MNTKKAESKSLWTKAPVANLVRYEPSGSRQDKLIGTASDDQIARRLNRPLKSVQARRHTLGVSAFARPRRGQRMSWSSEEESLLGKITDEKFAKGIFPSHSSRKKTSPRPRRTGHHYR
jgi:hypothetical protein